jgi:hypothetical protein
MFKARVLNQRRMQRLWHDSPGVIDWHDELRPRQHGDRIVDQRRLDEYVGAGRHEVPKGTIEYCAACASVRPPR